MNMPGACAGISELMARGRQLLPVAGGQGRAGCSGLSPAVAFTAAPCSAHAHSQTNAKETENPDSPSSRGVGLGCFPCCLHDFRLMLFLLASNIYL